MPHHRSRPFYPRGAPSLSEGRRKDRVFFQLLFGSLGIEIKELDLIDFVIEERQTHTHIRSAREEIEDIAALGKLADAFDFTGTYISHRDQGLREVFRCEPSSQPDGDRRIDKPSHRKHLRQKRAGRHDQAAAVARDILHECIDTSLFDLTARCRDLRHMCLTSAKDHTLFLEEGIEIGLHFSGGELIRDDDHRDGKITCFILFCFLSTCFFRCIFASVSRVILTSIESSGSDQKCLLRLGHAGQVDVSFLRRKRIDQLLKGRVDEGFFQHILYRRKKSHE